MGVSDAVERIRDGYGRCRGCGGPFPNGAEHLKACRYYEPPEPSVYERLVAERDRLAAERDYYRDQANLLAEEGDRMAEQRVERNAERARLAARVEELEAGVPVASDVAVRRYEAAEAEARRLHDFCAKYEITIESLDGQRSRLAARVEELEAEVKRLTYQEADDE